MDILFIIDKLCLPVVGALGMALAVPYIIARNVAPIMGKAARIHIDIMVVSLNLSLFCSVILSNNIDLSLFLHIV